MQECCQIRKPDQPSTCWTPCWSSCDMWIKWPVRILTCAKFVLDTDLFLGRERKSASVLSWCDRVLRIYSLSIVFWSNITRLLENIMFINCFLILLPPNVPPYAIIQSSHPPHSYPLYPHPICRGSLFKGISYMLLYTQVYLSSFALERFSFRKISLVCCFAE